MKLTFGDVKAKELASKDGKHQQKLQRQFEREVQRERAKLWRADVEELQRIREGDPSEARREAAALEYRWRTRDRQEKSPAD